jgi:hypothetical protein
MDNLDMGNWEFTVFNVPLHLQQWKNLVRVEKHFMFHSHMK